MSHQRMNQIGLGKWTKLKMVLVIFLLTATLHASDDQEWSFGGETYGVKAWFMVTNECKPNGIATVRVKLENTKAYPVNFHYRLKNSYWVKKEETLIPPNSIDSTYLYSTDEKTCRLKLDQLWGEAKLETQD
jgi:hypothetical protein